MSLAADRPEFAPPPQRGTVRALILALIAHALLIAALTWGVRWKRDSENDAACFAAFHVSIGVANLRGRSTLRPRYITSLPMGRGVAEAAAVILSLRQKL